MKAAKTQKISFITGSIPGTMLKFSGPYILGILVQNLYGAVDLLVVGRYATTADVSAVTNGSLLMTIVTQLIIGFATGITILIGQYCGARDHKSLARTTGTSVVMFGFAAAILTVIYLVFHETFVMLMQTPATAFAATKEYLIFCSLGIVFIIGYNVISSILTGMGDSKTPFIFILVACLINVVLDIILVRYVGWGARGAAIATTAAQAGSFFFSLLFLRVRGIGFSFSRSDLVPDPNQAAKILRIGGPVALQNVLVTSSFLFITAIINQIDVTASAAAGVVEKLITFLFVPATAMGTTVSTAASQNIGAGQLNRARQSMWWGILIAIIPAVIITAGCQWYGDVLAGIFTKDATVIALAANYLSSYIFDILMVSFVFCMNGYFNSQGQSWFCLVHSLFTTFAGRIPLSFLLSRMEDTSLFMIGLAAPISTFVSLIMCFIFLLYLRKRGK